jgi:hypothetical protein
MGLAVGYIAPKQRQITTNYVIATKKLSETGDH